MHHLASVCRAITESLLEAMSSTSSENESLGAVNLEKDVNKSGCSICRCPIEEDDTVAFNTTCKHTMHKECCKQLLLSDPACDASTGTYTYHFMRADRCP